MPVAQVIKDPDNSGELLLDLGTELFAQLDWQAGDILEWIDNKDGTWLIQSISQAKRTQLPPTK